MFKNCVNNFENNLISVVAVCYFLDIVVNTLSVYCMISHCLLCLSPSVTGEVYCFPHCQLIFIFDRRVIYHLKVL